MHIIALLTISLIVDECLLAIRIAHAFAFQAGILGQSPHGLVRGTRICHCTGADRGLGGRQIVARNPVGRARYRHALDVAGRLLSALIALAHARHGRDRSFSPDDKQLLNELAVLIQSASDQFEGGACYVTIEERARQLLAKTVGQNGGIARSVGFAAEALSSLNDFESSSPANEPIASAGILPVLSCFYGGVETRRTRFIGCIGMLRVWLVGRRQHRILGRHLHPGSNATPDRKHLATNNGTSVW